MRRSPRFWLVYASAWLPYAVLYFFIFLSRGRVGLGKALQIHNLATLPRAGVRVALESDTHGQDAAPAAAYTAGRGVFTPAEMVRMWSETTPRLLFATRRIGRLEGGYEASLLVLGCDPLARWECTADARLRIEQGQRIDVPPPPAGN